MSIPMWFIYKRNSYGVMVSRRRTNAMPPASHLGSVLCFYRYLASVSRSPRWVNAYAFALWTFLMFNFPNNLISKHKKRQPNQIGQVEIHFFFLSFSPAVFGQPYQCRIRNGDLVHARARPSLPSLVKGQSHHHLHTHAGHLSILAKQFNSLMQSVRTAICPLQTIRKTKCAAIFFVVFVGLKMWFECNEEEIVRGDGWRCVCFDMKRMRLHFAFEHFSGSQMMMANALTVRSLSKQILLF